MGFWYLLLISDWSGLNIFDLGRVESIFCCSDRVRSPIFDLGLGLGLENFPLIFFVSGQKVIGQYLLHI